MLGMYDAPENEMSLDESACNGIYNEVIDQINHEFEPALLQNPTEEQRRRIHERVGTLIAVALRKQNYRPGTQQEKNLAEELTRRILGLGFLDTLLPPARTDISEITIYSSGLIQIMKKGSVRWETVELHHQLMHSHN
jgi:pilus assembly protein CpaF